MGRKQKMESKKQLKKNIFILFPGFLELTCSKETVFSCFSHVQLFVTLWTLALQAPLSMGFSGQEYWSGLPCPSPGVFLTQGLNPGLHIAGSLFTV